MSYLQTAWFGVDPADLNNQSTGSSATQSVVASNGPQHVQMPSAMQQAWDKRSKKLKDWEKAWFIKYSGMDMETYVKELQKLCAQHKAKSRSNKIVKLVEPLFTTLRMYIGTVSGALGAAGPNAAPAYAVLGGIMCIMQISANYVQYQERIAKMFATMGDKAPILQQYERDIYATDDSIQQSLIDVYGDVLDFCRACLRLFVNEKNEIRRSLKLWGLSVWKPFEAELGNIVAQFDKDVALFEEKALLCDRRRQQQMEIMQRQNLDIQNRQTGLIVSLGRSVLQTVQGMFRQQQLNLEREFKIAERLQQMEENREKELQRKALLKWLDPVQTYLTIHDELCTAHLEGTGQWLLEDSSFEKWKEEDPSDLLWVNGRAGCGKSTLAALTIVDLALVRDTEIAVAYVYCKASTNSMNLLCSLIRQLCEQITDVQPVFQQWSDNIEDDKLPSWKDATAIMQSLISKFLKVYIVVDGLDECPDHDDLATFLGSAPENASSTVNIAVFSRPDYESFKKAFEKFEKVIKVDSGANEQDIKTYITNIVTADNVAVKKDAKLLGEVKETLFKKSDGMFLWVKLLVSRLKQQSTPRQVLETIQEVPNGLDGMYENCLQRIWAQEEFKRHTAYRILLWTINSKVPLNQEEMIEAIAIEPGIRVLDNTDLIDPRLLMEMCADLIRLNNEGCLVLVHISLKEYLLTGRREPSIEFQRFRELQENADKALADACLTYLTLSKFDCGPTATKLDLEQMIHDNPLLKYSVTYGVDHAKAHEGTDVSDLVSRLVEFRMNRNLTFQLYLWFQNGEFDASYSGSLLHFVAIFGLKDVLARRSDILTDCYEVDNRGYIPLDYALKAARRALAFEIIGSPSYKRQSNGGSCGHLSPIHYAAQWDWPEILDLLISSGENMNGTNEDGETPLLIAVGNDSATCIETLLKAGVDVHKPRTNGETPLILAADINSTIIAEKLIKAGADPTAQDEDGNTALHQAAWSKNVEVARLLLRHGADPSSKGTNEYSPLHIAAAENCTAMIHLFIESGTPINLKAEKDFTPLHIAAEQGSFDALKLLLGEGGFLRRKPQNGTFLIGRDEPSQLTEDFEILPHIADLVDDAGSTILHHACSNYDVPVPQLLLNQKALINRQNEQGMTPLILTTGGGNFSTSVRLLENGADPNLKMNDGLAPLHYVISVNMVDLMKPMIDAKADIDTPVFGFTPLILACRMERFQCAKQLLELCPNLDIDQVDECGRSALSFASASGAYDIVRLLLERGASISCDVDGYFPLHWAAGGGHQDVILCLVNDESVKQESHIGRQPLHTAALSGQLECVKLLQSKGGDISNKDKCGNTPLDSALLNSHTAVAEWLVSNGADPFTVAEDGYTPLHLAVVVGNDAVTKQLLNAGCNGLHSTRKYGYTPLSIAVTRNDVDIVKLLVQHGFKSISRICMLDAVECSTPEMFELLVELGVEFEYAIDQFGMSALHHAALGGNNDMLLYLIRNGLDPHLLSIDDITPLAAAAWRGCNNTVAKLLSFNVDIDPIDSISGRTPLLHAAAKQACHTVELLISAGANPTHRDRIGMSAFDLAQGHKPTLDMLRSNYIASNMTSPGISRLFRIKGAILDLLNDLLNQENTKPFSSMGFIGNKMEHLACFLVRLNTPDFKDLASLCYAQECSFTLTASSDKECDHFCYMCRNYALDVIYVCQTCTCVYLCSDCLGQYESGDDVPKATSRAFRDLESMNKSVHSVRNILERFLGRDLMAKIKAFDQFQIVADWSFEQIQEYDLWEDKYYPDGEPMEPMQDHRKYLKLLQEGKPYLADLRTRNKDGAVMKSSLKLLTRRIQVLDMKYSVGSEFSEFVCSGHEYLKVSQKRWQQAIDSGDVDSSTGKLSKSWLRETLNQVKAFIPENEAEHMLVQEHDGNELDTARENFGSVAQEESIATSEASADPPNSSRPSHEVLVDDSQIIHEEPDLSSDGLNVTLPIRSKTFSSISTGRSLKKTYQSSLAPQTLSIKRANTLPSLATLGRATISRQDTDRILSTKSTDAGKGKADEVPISFPVSDKKPSLEDAASSSSLRQIQAELPLDEDVDISDFEQVTWTNTPQNQANGDNTATSISLKYYRSCNSHKILVCALHLADFVEPGFAFKYLRDRIPESYFKDLNA